MARPVNRSPWRAALLPALVALLVPSPAGAQSRERRRLEACREVLEELLGGEERIPRDLLDRSECVAVVPSTKKLALGFGGRWGKGAVLCRSEAEGGSWSPPLMISLGGGSLGLQVGGLEADYVFLVMNPKGIDYLMRSQFTLGGDVAVAAGPLGRTGSASTDLRMHAEILSYSRSRGLFVGLSLEGAVVKQDRTANERVYGEAVNVKGLLRHGEYPVPAVARELVELLATSSPRRGPPS
ncbi:MAG TPA: lipid-binding SYLF domain-containing protein [Vicinamibacteria bacterium]|nr:lipid-binding SYLF domain-containing protein [Vicinamibacteria bacterium]